VTIDELLELARANAGGDATGAKALGQAVVTLLDELEVCGAPQPEVYPQQVIVTRLVGDHSLERRVVKLLTEKQRVIEASVEAASVDAEHVGESPAEQLANAAKNAKAVAVDIEAREAEHKAKREQEARERVERVRASIPFHDGRELDVDDYGKRGAANALEDWAAAGLQHVARLDPDHAAALNGVGFSRYDGEFGHSLAEQIRDRGRLSEKQWAACIKLARRYRRQIGDPEPEAPSKVPTAKKD